MKVAKQPPQTFQHTLKLSQRPSALEGPFSLPAAPMNGSSGCFHSLSRRLRLRGTVPRPGRGSESTASAAAPFPRAPPRAPGAGLGDPGPLGGAFVTAAPLWGAGGRRGLRGPGGREAARAGPGLGAAPGAAGGRGGAEPRGRGRGGRPGARGAGGGRSPLCMPV